MSVMIDFTIDNILQRVERDYFQCLLYELSRIFVQQGASYISFWIFFYFFYACKGVVTKKSAQDFSY